MLLTLLCHFGRLRGREHFQQPPLLQQFLEDPRQVGASAAPAPLLSFRIRLTPSLGHLV
jgi:hypothetical protein